MVWSANIFPSIFLLTLQCLQIFASHVASSTLSSRAEKPPTTTTTTIPDCGYTLASFSFIPHEHNNGLRRISYGAPRLLLGLIRTKNTTKFRVCVGDSTGVLRSDRPYVYSCGERRVRRCLAWNLLHVQNRTTKILLCLISTQIVSILLDVVMCEDVSVGRLERRIVVLREFKNLIFSK